MKDSMNLNQCGVTHHQWDMKHNYRRAAVLTCASRARCDCSCHGWWCTWCNNCCPHWSRWSSCIYVAIFVVIFCNWRCTLYNSMRMSFDPLYKLSLSNSEIFWFLYDWMWQSWPYSLDLWHFLLRKCRDQTWYVPKLLLFRCVTCLPVFDNLVLGLVRFVGCLHCFQQYQNPNSTSNHLS